jgi:hypothetical protein
VGQQFQLAVPVRHQPPEKGTDINFGVHIVGISSGCCFAAAYSWEYGKKSIDSLAPSFALAPFRGGVDIVHQPLLVDSQAGKIALRHFRDGNVAMRSAREGTTGVLVPWSSSRWRIAKWNRCGAWAYGPEDSAEC